MAIERTVAVVPNHHLTTGKDITCFKIGRPKNTSPVGVVMS